MPHKDRKIRLSVVDMATTYQHSDVSDCGKVFDAVAAVLEIQDTAPV